MGKDIRIESRSKFPNSIDPIYRLLDRNIFKQLFDPPKSGKKGEFEKLEYAEIDFLIENLKKHRLILWVNIILVVFLELYGLDAILNYGNMDIVVTGLLAPAMITGGAWYAVSFGGIPEKFINIAFTLTLAMFLSFSLSMTLLTCLLVNITPWFIGIFIIVPIYIGLYIASILYDNVDGLKIGLDSTLLKFSRASINYYQKHGFITSSETQKESFGEDSLFDSDKISLFTYYLNNLERNLNQLEEERKLPIANHLLASSTDLLYNILELREQTKIDKGEGYNDFLLKAYNLDQDLVDTKTINFLLDIVERLREAIGHVAQDELTRIKTNLNSFKDSSAAITDLDEQQHFADLIFSQTFRQVLELVSAYRQNLFEKPNANQ